MLYSTKSKPRSTEWFAMAFSKRSTHLSGSAISSLQVNQTALSATVQISPTPTKRSSQTGSHYRQSKSSANSLVELSTSLNWILSWATSGLARARCALHHDEGWRRGACFSGSAFRSNWSARPPVSNASSQRFFEAARGHAISSMISLYAVVLAPSTTHDISKCSNAFMHTTSRITSRKLRFARAKSTLSNTTWAPLEWARSRCHRSSRRHGSPDWRHCAAPIPRSSQLLPQVSLMVFGDCGTSHRTSS